ncbi:non-homologous end joining protein Ku [Bradyrhizobium sp. LM2.7]
MDKGLVGTLLRYPYEVRSEQEYFDEIQDVKVTKDMLDLARHIVNQKAGNFDPEKFEDHYETALIELINQKRAGSGRESRRCYSRRSSGARLGRSAARVAALHSKGRLLHVRAVWIAPSWLPCVVR